MDAVQGLDPAGAVSNATFAIFGIIVVFAVPIILSHYRARRTKRQDDKNFLC